MNDDLDLLTNYNIYSRLNPGSVLAIRSPLSDLHIMKGSPMSERSSGDGGSDNGETGHYATVGRKMRIEGLYSSPRRPDGGNITDNGEYDPYSSIHRRGSEGSSERVYETIHRHHHNENNVSSETSSVSQVTVRQVNEIAGLNMSELYARVDLNKKKARNSSDCSSDASPLSPDYANSEAMVEAAAETPPRKTEVERCFITSSSSPTEPLLLLLDNGDEDEGS